MEKQTRWHQENLTSERIPKSNERGNISNHMVRAVCKHQKAEVTADIEEAIKQFAPFQPQLLHTLRLLELVLLIPLLLCIDLSCDGLRQIMIVFKDCSGSEAG